jgi:phosphate transport system protein
MEQPRTEFHHQLDVIQATVAELFGMITEDLPKATQALLDGRDDAFGELAERERAIDALYLEVEQLAGREILLQAPVASDLRFLLSVLRIAPELERSHDLVMQIAAAASRGGGDALSPAVRELTRRLGELASSMWRQAAACWGACDHPVVTALSESHEVLDELHGSLMAELATGRMAVPATMAMTLVTRCYERLGSHAVNIARREAYVGGVAAR